MITLKQAIELATQAHAGQWGKSQNLDKETAKLFMCMEEELYPTILSNGNKVFIKDETFVMQKPYITHPLAVMEMMSTEEEKIVAVLHDAIEDTEATLYPHDGLFIKYKDLRYELTKEVYTALHSITKWKCDGKTYEEHIRDISKNKLATKVKLADIFHNMSCEPSEHAKQKYLKALPILLKGI